ncbi:MAG: FAD-dependent oxidoreductase [Micromonosporaceae bacterium]|nr:FAD-dependent oxidoreductase [Micromonosporaceae bacterium]
MRNGSEHFETVIIGGGQAGLATGYHLARRNRRFVILDANQRVGDNWRCHWDSLRLYSPARYDGLPGMPFPASPWSYPTKDDVAEYLAAYAARFDLPVRNGVRADALSRDGDRYVITYGDRSIEADNVVVATGTFGRTPYLPGFATELDPGIVQLHSGEYRNPSQLRPGGVLVVGASHSGSDIAHEVAASHEAILCGRDTGQVPFRLESRLARAIFPVLWFVWTRILTVKTPMGRKLRPEVRAHGGPLLRVKRADLAAAGVERVEARVSGVRHGRPLLDDGRVLDVTNVVWCTGFRQDFDWIRIPVIGDDGWPLEQRGVVASSPGLYFTGLSFQHSFSSMLVGGAGRDAEHIVEHIDAHMSKDRPVGAASASR